MRSIVFGLMLVTTVAITPPLKPQPNSEGTETRIMVRAVSRDAKLLSDQVGGARVTIRNAKSGEILAQGIQTGRSGSTESIILKPQERSATVYDTPGAAGFLATLKLQRPTVVEISAEGPLDTPQSIYRASKTMLVAPGQDILGEGVLLEIHGFRVNLEIPVAGAAIEPGEEIPVRAKITMT